MELKHILEAILFSAQKPLSVKELRDVLAAAPEHAEGDDRARALRKVREDELSAALELLAVEHQAAGRAYRLVCVAGAWQFVTQPEYAPWLKALVGHKARPPRLSQPALETLAIVAYRQPVTRAELEQVRGVSVDGVVQTLLERGLIEQAGRAEVIGRPMTYGTTAVFLEYFGLRSLEDLPAADELRRVPAPKPAGPVTLEPGLATAPPEQLTLPTPESPRDSPKESGPATLGQDAQATAGGTGVSPVRSAPDAQATAAEAPAPAPSAAAPERSAGAADGPAVAAGTDVPSDRGQCGESELRGDAPPPASS
jgi:segregation and condensation protein B